MNDNSKRKILNQNSITKKWAEESKKWAQESIEDELKGQKRIMVKVETYEALRDIAKMNESYDEIIMKCIQSYKKDHKNELDGIMNDEEGDE